MVGVAGFEPATLWSQTRCATRLRYTPNVVLIQQILIFSKHKHHQKRAIYSEYAIYKRMIISCTKCSKKFNVDDKLIPLEGRFLQCGSCNNKWFFKKDNKEDYNNITFEEISPQKIFESKNKKKEANNNIIDENSLKKVKNSNKSINFLNKLIVLIISLIALILIMDTFKSPISKFIPNIDFILTSLYESIKDIFLFFKDLIK